MTFRWRKQGRFFWRDDCWLSFRLTRSTKGFLATLFISSSSNSISTIAWKLSLFNWFICSIIIMIMIIIIIMIVVIILGYWYWWYNYTDIYYHKCLISNSVLISCVLMTILSCCLNRLLMVALLFRAKNWRILGFKLSFECWVLDAEGEGDGEGKTKV